MIIFSGSVEKQFNLLINKGTEIGSQTSLVVTIASSLIFCELYKNFSKHYLNFNQLVCVKFDIFQ